MIGKALATVTENEILTSGMINAKIKFEFSEDWTSNISKTAIFTAGDVTKVVLDSYWENNVCSIPQECLAKSDEILMVGIYGADNANVVAIPTVWATVGKIRKGYEGYEDVSTGTLPIWAQVQSAAAQSATAAKNAQDAAEAAQGKAEDAQSAAEAAARIAVDAKEKAVTAQGKAEDAQEAAEAAKTETVAAAEAVKQLLGEDHGGAAVAVQKNLNIHIQDKAVHVTEEERTAWNAKQNALTFDSTPTAGSTNPITSGGVKAALDDLPKPIIGTTPPTTSTVGVVGQEYIDTAAKLVYHCTAAGATGYTWEVYSAGRSTKVNTTLYASSWTTAKKYTVSNANITATSAVELLPRENNGITQAQLEALSGAMIVGGTQAAGSIQLVALGDKPTTDIPVTLIIRRDL